MEKKIFIGFVLLFVAITAVLAGNIGLTQHLYSRVDLLSSRVEVLQALVNDRVSSEPAKEVEKVADVADDVVLQNTVESTDRMVHMDSGIGLQYPSSWRLLEQEGESLAFLVEENGGDSAVVEVLVRESFSDLVGLPAVTRNSHVAVYQYPKEEGVYFIETEAMRQFSFDWSIKEYGLTVQEEEIIGVMASARSELK